MKNTPTINDLANMNASDIAELPLDMIKSYYADIKKSTATNKKAKSNLNDAILVKYVDVFNKEEIGTFTHNVDNLSIKVVVGKSVEWDEKALADKRLVIANNWKDDPDAYIDVKYSINETKYSSWSDNVKAHFIGARTMKPKTPTITIKENN